MIRANRIWGGLGRSVLALAKVMALTPPGGGKTPPQISRAALIDGGGHSDRHGQI